MRSKANENGVSVKTYAGTTGVLLGMNVEPRKWEGLLGFALERLDGSSGEKEWLKAIVPFPGTEREPGELFATNVAPVQRFRWSDYRVYPDTEYAYTVHSVYGSPAEPTVGDGPTVAVRTADPGGAHGVQPRGRGEPGLFEEVPAGRGGAGRRPGGGAGSFSSARGGAQVAQPGCI